MIDLTITEALEKLKSREISATELTHAYLERIEKYGADLNCYITTTPERALADANAAFAQPPRHACWKILFHNTNRPYRKNLSTPAQFCWAKRTWTNSQWAHSVKQVSLAHP